MDRPTSFVDEYFGAWNAHDVDGLLAHMTEDVVYADLALGETHRGTADVRGFIEDLEAHFCSDYRLDPGDLVVLTDDGYAVEWTMSGTNDRADEQRGLPATGKRFQVQGVSIGRLRDGRIAENRDYWNLAGYLVQVGLMPEAAGAGV
jgi:steroid delta-isomerase-like uncharacterized protein